LFFVLLKALIEIWEISAPPPHIIPVAMVIFKNYTSVGKDYKIVAFVSIFATLNLLDVIVSTIALLAVKVQTISTFTNMLN
jgi:hypothetical protein